MALNIVGANNAILMAANVTFDAASTLYTSADAAYSAWCAELGIDPAVSSGNFNGDDTTTYLADVGREIAPAKDAVFKKHAQLSTEGALGLYDCDPSDTTSVNANMPNVNRMFLTNTNPIFVLTYHMVLLDAGTFSSKWNKSANGFCARGNMGHYGSETTYSYRLALQVSKGKIRLFIENVSCTGTLPIYANAYAGAGSTLKNVINQYLLGTAGAPGSNTFVELNFGESYKTSGYATYVAPLGNHTGFTTHSIHWTQDTPEGTTVEVKSVVNDSGTVAPDSSAYDVVTNGGAVPDIISGMEVSGKYLWIRVSLATSDTTKTPSVSGIYLLFTDAESARKFQLNLTYAGRVMHPQGNVNVAYAASIGNIRNAAGTLAVSSFNFGFNPDEAALTLFFNPADIERISLDASLAVLDVGKVEYVDCKNGNEQVDIGDAHLIMDVRDTQNNQV